MTPLRDRVETILRAEFAPEHLEIVDESDRHAGHPGATSGGGHLRVVLVSRRFDGLTRLERHRRVYAALGALVGGDVHALGLRTATPDEWARSGGGGP